MQFESTNQINSIDLNSNLNNPQNLIDRPSSPIDKTIELLQSEQSKFSLPTNTAIEANHASNSNSEFLCNRSSLHIDEQIRELSITEAKQQPFKATDFSTQFNKSNIGLALSSVEENRCTYNKQPMHYSPQPMHYIPQIYRLQASYSASHHTRAIKSIDSQKPPARNSNFRKTPQIANQSKCPSHPVQFYELYTHFLHFIQNLLISDVIQQWLIRQFTLYRIK